MRKNQTGDGEAGETRLEHINRKKPVKKNTRKTSDRKKLVRLADTWFSKYIRKRDGECVICGKRTSLTCGHVFTRSYYPIRWDENNAYCQCSGCNYRHEFDPMPLYSICRADLGNYGFDELYAKGRAIKKFTNDDLKEFIEYWKKEYKKIESTGFFSDDGI